MRLKVVFTREPGDSEMPDVFISIVGGRLAVECRHVGVGDDMGSTLVRYFVEGRGFPTFKKDGSTGDFLRDPATGRLIAEGFVDLDAPSHLVLRAIRDNLVIGGQYEVTEEKAQPLPPQRAEPPAPPIAIAKLVLLARDDDSQESEFALHEETTIGAHPDCAIQILDRSLGKLHARVRLHGQTFVLTDLGSPGGTQVGSRRLEGQHAPLEAGDVIRLGSRRLIFVPRPG